MLKVPKITRLQYFKKEVRDKFDVLHANKHQIFLQVDTISFDGHSQACSDTKNSKLAKFCEG